MTVFILGAGLMQVPAIRAAREAGCFVAAADGNPDALGASLADAFYPVDLKDRSGLEAVARRLSSERGLDGVFTAGTDFSASVAWVAERLGLPGIPFDAALDASDKLRMRAVFEASGLPSPRFACVTSTEGLAALLAGRGLSPPLVVKPADNMGARGCRLARDAAELEAAVSEALPFSRSGRAIVEEYMEGPEFSLDALVVDGEVRLRGFADRNIHFPPYFVELGHTMPTAAEPPIQAEVLRVFAAGVKALGITRGAAKGDMKWVPSARGGLGQAMIGEIAARLSGGYMSGWTYPYASGIDLTAEALTVAVGQALESEPVDRGWTSAERAFISLPGEVVSVLGLRAAEHAPYIKNVFCRVSPGQSCVFPANNVEKCGNVISQAPTRDEAVAAAMDAIRGILVRLKPGVPATEAFLRGQWPGDATMVEGSWPPRAFSLPGPVAAAVAALPESDQVLPPSLGAAFAAFPDRDWAGRTILESANLALAVHRGHSPSTMVPRSALPADAACLPGAFWRALVAGGAQGGLVVLDGRGGPA